MKVTRLEKFELFLNFWFDCFILDLITETSFWTIQMDLLIIDFFIDFDKSVRIRVTRVCAILDVDNLPDLINVLYHAIKHILIVFLLEPLLTATFF